MWRPSYPGSLLMLDINILVNFHQTQVLKNVPCYNLHFLLLCTHHIYPFFFGIMVQKQSLYVFSILEITELCFVFCYCTGKVNHSRPAINLSCLVKLKLLLNSDSWSQHKALMCSVSTYPGVQRLSGWFDPACQPCLLITMSLKSCTWFGVTLRNARPRVLLVLQQGQAQVVSKI